MANRSGRVLVFGALIALSLTLVACGGGGSTPRANPTAKPSGSPTVSPSGSPSTSPSTSPSAEPTGVAGTFATTIVNSDTAAFASSNIELYIYGQNVNAPNAFVGVNANGSTYAINSSTPVAPIKWLGGTSNSETVYLPALIGARVYIFNGAAPSGVFGVIGSGGPTAPAPWSNDGTQSQYFDDVEYAETTLGDVNFDLSQTDVLGLDLEVTAVGTTTQTIGLKSGAITAFAAALSGLGSPWSTLANDMPYHIMNPQHGTPNFFPSSTFLDSGIMTAWNTYEGGNWMEITAASLSATGYSGALYGTVDGSGNFDFYNGQSTADTLIGTIENPTTYAASNSETVTTQTLAQNGVFGNFMTAYAPNPSLGPAVGNRLSGALNSGVMQSSPPATGSLLTVQPICTGRFPTAGLPYDNQYASALHTVAQTDAYVAGAAYGYPYDDLCGTSTDTTSTSITSMTITVNPS